MNILSFPIGMTTQQQEQKLSEFRLGNCQIMVATLGEEGLDIEKCNLVLNYNYVKNEISLVQKRGELLIHLFI